MPSKLWMTRREKEEQRICHLQMLRKSCTIPRKSSESWSSGVRGVFTEPGYHPKGAQSAPVVMFCLLHNLFTWYGSCTDVFSEGAMF